MRKSERGREEGKIYGEKNKEGKGGGKKERGKD